MQAGASLQEARRMSLYEWVLTTQSHQRNEIRRDSRALWIVNCLAEGEVTLNDVYGTQPAPNGQGSESFKKQVMRSKGITKDLTVYQK